jgi:hypothetical protein
MFTYGNRYMRYKTVFFCAFLCKVRMINCEFLDSLQNFIGCRASCVSKEYFYNCKFNAGELGYDV